MRTKDFFERPNLNFLNNVNDIMEQEEVTKNAKTFRKI